MTAYVFKRKRPPVLQYTGDYTKTGSFGQINKGVASGFSSSNYLTTPDVFPSNASSFEMVICFKSSNISSTADIAGSTSSANNNKVPEFRMSGSKLNIYQDGITVSLTGSTTLLSDTWYWAKLSFNGSEYKLELSTDGITYTTEATKSSTSKNTGGVPFSLGLGWGQDSVVPFTNGSIDLSQSYISINGERWWSGDSYTKVGSWIDDNVVSGFSKSNYLTIDNSFSPQSNPWEMIFAFTTNEDISTTQVLVDSNNGLSYRPIGMYIGNSKMKIVLSSSTSSNNIAKDVEGTKTLSSNTKYYYKLEFNGSSYIGSISSDGSLWEVDVVVESSVNVLSGYPFILGKHTNNTYPQPFKGSIDLTESYIKVDGEYWWQGAELVTPVKNYVLRKKQYWKKIVTEVTKYWKETTTETTELAYACYKNDLLDSLGYLRCVYIKTPLSTTSAVYVDNDMGLIGLVVSSSSELYVFTSLNSIKSITESTASIAYKNTMGGISTEGFTRYTAGDLYETVTTTTVVEGTPDDYTYTETEVIEVAVAGTPEDYDFITDKSYVLRRKHYWKYEYQDWTQPVLTANGTMGGNSFAVKLSSVQGSHPAFHAFDNKTDTFARTGAPQPQWFMMYNPNPLNISKIEYIFGTNNLWATSLDIQASVDGVDNSWVTLLSLSELKPQDYTWDIDTGGKSYKYYRLYIKSANRTDPTQGGYYAQFSELKLTAQEQITVKATKDDYDFVTD